MFKIFAWRVCFEFLNLRKIFFEDKSEVKYFAYGANLDPEVLKDRKITPINEKEFVVEDYELRFSHPGPFEGMGFASLDKNNGAKTYGKLYTLTHTDLRRLDYYELVPFLHRYKRAEIKQNGLVFYIFNSNHASQSLKPTQNYKNSILNGLKKTDNVPDSYVARIEKTKVIENFIPAKNLNFIFNTSARKNYWIKIVFQKLDQMTVHFFVNYILDRSLTERFIHVNL